MTFEKLHLIDELPYTTKRQLPATFNKMKPPRDNILQTLGSSDFNKTRHMLHPEPLPYQTQVFKSSTLTKMVEIPRRHEDSFNCIDAPNLRKKGVILHSSRYAWDQMHRADKISQRERLLLEKEEIEKARDMKRNRESVNYREKYNLLLGGEKIGSLSYISHQLKDEPHQSTPHELIPHAQAVSIYHPPLSRDSSQQNLSTSQSSPQALTHIPNVNSMKQVLRAGAAISNLPPTSWEMEAIPRRQTLRNPNEDTSSSPLSAAYSMAVAAQKLKLFGRSQQMSSDSLARTHEQPSGSSLLTNANEDWKHVPRIPFPFYFSMTSSAASVSEWDNYLTRQQRHLRDLTEFSKNIDADGEADKGFIQHYIIDGSKANMNERSSVIEELNFLKSLILPDVARDLYVGRGIKLPSTHATVKPRPTLPHVTKTDSGVSTRKQSYEILTSSGKGRVFINMQSPSSESQFKVPPSSADRLSQSPLKHLEDGENKSLSLVHEVAVEKIPFPSIGTEIVDPFKDVTVNLSEEDSVFMEAVIKNLPAPSEGKKVITEFKQLVPLLSACNLHVGELRFIRMLFEMTAASRQGFGETEISILIFIIHQIIQMSGPIKESFKSLTIPDIYEVTPRLLDRFHKPLSGGGAGNSGEISAATLSSIVTEIITVNGTQKPVESVVNKMREDLLLSGDTAVTKVNYILYAPYFISLLSTSQLQKRPKSILPPL